MSNCQHRQPQSEQASPSFLCILAVAPFTHMMGDDNIRAFSVNLCILTGSAQKVPRALFNHMLLHTFSSLVETAGKCEGRQKKNNFFFFFLHLFVWCCCICAELQTSEEKVLVYAILSWISNNSSNIVIQWSHDFNLTSYQSAQDCLTSYWPPWSVRGS